jgi:hypothetical protein
MGEAQKEVTLTNAKPFTCAFIKDTLRGSSVGGISLQLDASSVEKKVVQNASILHIDQNVDNVCNAFKKMKMLHALLLRKRSDLPIGAWVNTIQQPISQALWHFEMIHGNEQIA